jgi:TPP-dependent pyruvate/acetoin dehydrogenase alpha subunit
MTLIINYESLSSNLKNDSKLLAGVKIASFFVSNIFFFIPQNNFSITNFIRDAKTTKTNTHKKNHKTQKKKE